MNRKNLMVGQLCAYEEMEKMVYQFEDMLKSHGIPIVSKSELEGACLAVLDLLGKKNLPDLRNPFEDIRPYYVDVMSLWTFMMKLLRLHDKKGFDQLIPHIALLNSGTFAQNKKTLVTEQGANKLFELLFALVCLEIGRDLSIDDPKCSKGDNPDILVTINDERWGFACKTLHSRTAKTIYENIEKGVAQIEASEATIGCVILNFKNILDHDLYWPILNETEVKNEGALPLFSFRPDPKGLISEISTSVTRIHNEIFNHAGKRVIEKTFLGKKALPGFLAFSQTVTGIQSALGPVPSLVGMLTIAPLDEITRNLSVFESLNAAFHECPR